jgi:hypothetical protein
MPPMKPVVVKLFAQRCRENASMVVLGQLVN